MSHNKTTHHSKGFTLIELLIIAPIVILVIGGFLSFLINITGEVLASRGSSVLVYNIQDALDRIQQDVQVSGGFLSKTNIALVSPQGYDNGTQAFTNNSNGTSLILNSYATTSNPVNSNNTQSLQTVYSKEPNACSSSLSTQNILVYTNIVYFVKTNAAGVSSLWRRTIVPADYETAGSYCSVPWQQPSCAIGYTSSFCKTNDIELVDGVSSTGFVVSYYPSANSGTANTAATTGSDSTARQTAISTTNTLHVSITASQTFAGRKITQSSSMQVTGINNDFSVTPQ